MTISSTSSIRNLSDVIRGLSEASGSTVQNVVDFEMGKVLEKCVALTPAASIAKIADNYATRQWTTGYPGSFVIDRRMKKYRIAGSGRYGKQKKDHRNRYPDWLWSELQGAQRQSEEKAILLRGLSKQSWLRLAEMLGYTIKATKYVQKIPNNFNQNFNVTRSGGKSGEYFVGILNAQPTINRIGGKRIVKKAVAGRVGYFKRNMENGVLADAAKLAKAYPGLHVMQGGQMELI